MDLSLTPSVVLVVFLVITGYPALVYFLDLLLDSPGAVLLGSCSWKNRFFSLFGWDLFKACSQQHTYTEGLLQFEIFIDSPSA